MQTESRIGESEFVVPEIEGAHEGEMSGGGFDAVFMFAAALAAAMRMLRSRRVRRSML